MLPGFELPTTLFPGNFSPLILLVCGLPERAEFLQNTLAEQGFSSELVGDAESAFRFVREREPDIVLIDREIEGDMEPREICSVIKEDPVLQATQIVLVTRENSSDELNDSIRSQADTCIAERFDAGEVKIHLAKVVQTRSIYRQMQSLNDKLQKMFLELARLNKEKEVDLKEGGVFQKSIFPGQDALEEDFRALKIETSLYYRPFPEAQVSGDFWDIYPFAADNVGFLLADAVGHGIPAAFYSLYTVSALRRMITEPGVDYFSRLSDELFRIMQGKHLAAAFCTFHADSLTFYNAGLPAPVYIGADGAQAIEHYGPVLGAFARTPTYEPLELAFETGQALVLCTDGIVEAKNAAGEEYGSERLLAICSHAAGESASRIARAIRSDVEEFLDGNRSGDDTTIVVFRRI